MRRSRIASVLVVALALVALPTAALASSSKITTCDKLAASYGVDGIDKVDGSSGTLSGEWGSVSWTSNDVTDLEVADGALVWLCVKTGGGGGENVFDHVIEGGDSVPPALQDLRYAISHVAVYVVDVEDPGDPEDPEDPPVIT